jgi:hypothetical protein
LTIQAGGNIRLAQHFEKSASRMGTRVQRANETFNLDVIFGGGNVAFTEDAPTITLSWMGADSLANTPADTPAAVDPRKLHQAGQSVSLALGIMAREIAY